MERDKCLNLLMFRTIGERCGIGAPAPTLGIDAMRITGPISARYG
jgi:hypothetical protein